MTLGDPPDEPPQKRRTRRVPYRDPLVVTEAVRLRAAGPSTASEPAWRG
jgi:hypothetical protein